jgi:hypothetical protein
MRFKAYSLYVLLGLFGPAIGASSIRAASIKVVTAETRYAGDFRCNMRLDGEIKVGDFATFVSRRGELDEQISKKLEVNGTMAEMWSARAPILCLNSNGGSYHEGLKIAEFLLDKGDKYDRQMTTFVGDRSQCHSACALIFLAGKATDRGGERYPARVLHVGGAVGFHAPYIDPSNLPSKLYGPADLIAVYRGAIESISEAIDLFDYRTIGGPGVVGDNRPWVNASLFVQMLRRGPTDLFLIDSVGKAGRWGIKITGERRIVRLAPLALKRACENASAWQNDQIEWKDSPFEEVAKKDPEFSELKLPSNVSLFKYALVYSTVKCAALAVSALGDDGKPQQFVTSVSVGFLRGEPVVDHWWQGGYQLDPWTVYPPDTTIGQLR